MIFLYKLSASRRCTPRSETDWANSTACLCSEGSGDRRRSGRRAYGSGVRHSTPPNTETNAVRSEVTVDLTQLEARGLRDAPLRKSALECNFIKSIQRWSVLSPDHKARPYGKQSYRVAVTVSLHIVPALDACMRRRICKCKRKQVSEQFPLSDTVLKAEFAFELWTN